MQRTSERRRPARDARSRRPLRRLVLALAVGVVAVGGVTSEAAASHAPGKIAGDPHSPRVAGLATQALEAKATWHTSNSDADRQLYLTALKRTAAATAGEMAVSKPQMTEAWLATDDAHQTALLSALTQLGVEYRSATSEPGVGFDCSGLMYFAWGQAGFTLARQSGAQISDAAELDLATAKAGDLAQYPGHVMMYLGVPRAFVHASNPQNDVELWLASEDRAQGLRYGDPSE